MEDGTQERGTLKATDDGTEARKADDNGNHSGDLIVVRCRRGGGSPDMPPKCMQTASKRERWRWLCQIAAGNRRLEIIGISSR